MSHVNELIKEEFAAAGVTDDRLLEAAIKSARPRRYAVVPRWSAVMDCFALGSTF